LEALLHAVKKAPHISLEQVNARRNITRVTNVAVKAELSAKERGA
jgi:hypothetical protein